MYRYLNLYLSLLFSSGTIISSYLDIILIIFTNLPNADHLSREVKHPTKVSCARTIEQSSSKTSNVPICIRGSKGNRRDIAT